MVPGSCMAIIFDASPWGGGAILYRGQQAIETMVCEWTTPICEALGTVRGESAYLSFYEALVALVCLHIWCGSGGHHRVALIGDNLAALTVAVSQRGKGDLGRVCREVALRQAQWSLDIAVGHLPTEQNKQADALSRLAAPGPPAFPPELVSLPRHSLPRLSELFRIEPPRDP